MRLKDQAENVDIQGSIPEGICGDCMKGRQQRKPSRTLMIRSTQPLHHIHSDLMGPLPTTRRGERYLMILKNDYTRAQWIYSLKTKNMAFSKFKEFKAMLEKQIKEKVKYLRSDGCIHRVSKLSEGKWDQVGAHGPTYI